MFVKIIDPASIAQRLKAACDDVEVVLHPGAGYVCVEQGRPNYKRLPADFAGEFSRRFADLVSVQLSSYGNFLYEHWTSGRLARCLAWAEGGVWEVEGQPEPWEPAAFGPSAPSPGAREPAMDPERAYAEIQNHFRLPPID
jgi:hypothetical protein